ncbi:hypothetical protein [uncultured Streptococcus sp.]|uniref:hypothetical protein n=1 Tax=uncultured Streptococcus sp. TaxID=83427 RepID=UPI002598D45D|nr:hypothetical protein [uncultured Streptococcus sp.]
MGQKNINPDKIKSVNAAYSDMSDNISDTASIVGDDSQELLQNGTDAIKTVSKGITTTVEKLNKYLNGVADAFEKSDLAVANGIESGTVATFSGGTAKQNQKNNKAYGKLPD